MTCKDTVILNASIPLVDHCRVLIVKANWLNFSLLFNSGNISRTQDG